MTALARETLCLAASNAYFSTNYFPGIKLIISTDGTFNCEVNGNVLHNVSGLILNRNAVHTISAPATSVLMYYFDRHSTLELLLDAQLSNQPWLDISNQLAAAAFMNGLPNRSQDLPSVAESILTELFPAIAPRTSAGRDKRVETLINYIDDNIHHSISLADLAPIISLSIERTRHIFEEQMGMTFSQYVLWTRLRSVIQTTLVQPQPLGKIAMHYGFTDQSHFNRIFKRVFGSKPYTILKHNGMADYHCFTVPAES